MSAAPSFRSVDQFTGEARLPGKFFQALSEADSLCRELDGLRELQCRIDELEDEVAHQSELRMTVVRENARLNRQLALAQQLLARAQQDRDTAKAEIAGRTP